MKRKKAPAFTLHFKQILTVRNSKLPRRVLHRPVYVERAGFSIVFTDYPIALNLTRNSSFKSVYFLTILKFLSALNNFEVAVAYRAN